MSEQHSRSSCPRPWRTRQDSPSSPSGPRRRGSRCGIVKAPMANLADFAALDPFFRIIEQGLDGLVEPGHFFDILAEDVTVDYVVTVPGYPRHIEGRAAVAELYRPYGTMIILDRCFDLAVHHDATKGVVVLEYASDGHVVGTRHRYSNRYISALTLRESEVAHWRDHPPPPPLFDAASGPPPLTPAH